jgi:hypothetical protein
MQTPKGTVFFQVSGMVLILIATTLYQKGLPQEPKLSALATQRSDYERYEEVLKLLDENHPIAALELLTSLPREKLGIANALLRDPKASLAPGILFLRLGMSLAHHAAESAQRNAPQEAQLFRNACATLQQRLQEGGYPGEDAVERNQRLQIAELLQRFTQRSELIIQQYQST